MNERQVKDILLKLKDLSIIVIGDFFLDRYLQIDHDKNELSLETGLTAYQVVKKKNSAGAAGTITNNLRALGTGNVIAIGILGDDGEGFDLTKSLNNSGVQTKYLIKSAKRITPCYTKPFITEKGNIKEINRFDMKNWAVTPSFLEDKIIENLDLLFEEADAVIVLDQVLEQNYGVITGKVRIVLSKLINKKPDLVVFCDSRAHIAMFDNVIIKCNHYEAVKSFYPDLKEEPDENMVNKAGMNMSKKTGKPVFITYGKNGIFVFYNNKIERIPTVAAMRPFDICGAGDAATSGIVIGLCCNTSLADAALLGNIASSIVIKQLGTTGIATASQVMERYKEFSKENN